MKPFVYAECKLCGGHERIDDTKSETLINLHNQDWICFECKSIETVNWNNNVSVI